MKKITLLFALILAAVSVNAQTTHFSENFDTQTSGAAPTGGFTVKNNDSCNPYHSATFPNKSWVVLDKMAAAESYSNPSGCQADDWLVTPVINLTSVTGMTRLAFDIRSFSGTYKENYEVLISTTDTAVASFTSLLTVNNASNEWTNQDIDISTYNGNNVYIAFRLTSTDKWILLLDNIKVFSPATNDAKTEKIVSPVTSGCTLGSENVVATIKNKGATAITSIDVTYRVQNGLTGRTIDSVRQNFTFSGTGLAYGASQNITFTTPTTALTADSLYLIEIWSSLTGDSELSNDSIYRYVASVTPSTIPYSTSFELVSGSSVDLSAWAWTYQNALNNFPFAPRRAWASNGSYSLFHFLGTSSGAADVWAFSPCINVTAGKKYRVKFKYQGGSDNAGVPVPEWIEVGHGAGANVGAMTIIRGDTLKYNSYVELVYDFEATSTGSYNIGIHNKTPNGWTIAIDDFIIDTLTAPTAPAVANTWNACDSTATVNFTVVAGNTYTINWGDGSAVETVTSAPATHKYTVVGGSPYTATVTVTNVAGTANNTTSIIATAPAALNPEFTSTINGNSVTYTITNPNPCSTYEWSFGDGTPNTTGTQVTHTYSSPGDFTVEVTETASNGASKLKNGKITITSINEIDFVNGINVFPNPANDNVNIAFELNSAQNVEIALVSLDGKVVKTLANSNVTKVNEKLNVANLAKGIYVLDITTAEGKFTTNLVVR